MILRAAELKPCPFCGETTLGASSQVNGNATVGHYIECGHCQNQGPWMFSASAAADAWNTRPSPWRSLKDDPPDPNASVESLRNILVKNPSRDHWHGRIVKLARDGGTWVDDDNEDPWTLERYADSGCTEWMEVPE